MPFHAIAVLSGNRQKTIPNKSEDQILSQVVLPFVSKGVITAKWGKKAQSYQVLELHIFETPSAWDKRTGPLTDLIRRKRNQFPRLKDKRRSCWARTAPGSSSSCPFRVRSTGHRRINGSIARYNKRFVAVESVIAHYGGVAIRIDKEHPLEDLVGRIEKEIRDAAFIVADLTDERPSCYFEAGYAEAPPVPLST